MLEDILDGVIVNVIAVAGHRLAVELSGLRGRKKKDLQIATWFDTYQLVKVDAGPWGSLKDESATLFTEILRSDEIHALLHDLLAVRLAGAPQSEVALLAGSFERAFTRNSNVYARLAGEVFSYADEQIREMVERLSHWNPDILKHVRDQAQFNRTNAILRAIERHCAALSSDDDPAVNDNYIERYRQHVIDHHGLIDPPDLERRRRVPIDELYVGPILTFEDSDGRTIETDIQRVISETDRTVILGDPGGGKTTLCQTVMYSRARIEDGTIPFLVSLREFAAESPLARSVVGYLNFRLETFYQCPAPTGLIGRLLLNGSALIIFDGLDELTDASWRAEVSTVIERFCVEYPQARVLVTSRTIGYEQARLDQRQFTVYRLADFNERQIADYAVRWFSQEERISGDQAQQWASSFLAESAEVADLRANPLLLALMCLLYSGEGSIPRNRPEMYEKCATLLLRKWDMRRRIEADPRMQALVEPTLRHLAFWLLNRNSPQPIAVYSELVAQTSTYFQEWGIDKPSEAEVMAEEFIALCHGRAWVFTDVGTTAQGRPIYAFTHTTFMEYFAASHLASTCDTPEALARHLAPKVAKEEWDAVAMLAAQIKCSVIERGAERFGMTLLNERRRRGTVSRGKLLGFLCRCLAALEMPPRFVRTLTDQVFDYLLQDPIQQSGPLGELLFNCNNYRKPVSDRLRDRIDEMVASSAVSVRALGLAIAVHGSIGARNVAAGQARPSPNIDNRQYWWAFAWDNVRRYAPQLTNTAQEDDGVACTALIYGCIGMKEFLAADPQRMALLFSMPPVRVGKYVHMPYAAMCLQNGHFSPQDPRSGFRLNNLSEFYEHLRALGDPPWVQPRTAYFNHALLAYMHRGIDEGFASSISNPLNQEQMAGAVLLLLIMAEAEQVPNREILVDGVLGQFASMSPYIQQRWFPAEAHQLGSFPVSARIADLVTSWALHKVSFLAQAE